MHEDPLLSSRIKIDRAIKHFNDLTGLIKEFAARDAHSFWVDEQSEPAIHIYRIHIFEDIPAEWSGCIGDVIHNLRSSLDCLASALLLRYAANVSEDMLRETYFPIGWNEAQLSSERTTRFFTRVGPQVEKVIRRLQPYRGGKGHVLWQLDQLDIADKHRRILLARGCVTDIKFLTPPPVEGQPVTIPKYQAPFPLKDGDEVCRVAFFQPHFDANAHFTIDIAFNEPVVAERTLVIPTLNKIINFMQRLLMIFEKRYF